MYNIIYVQYSLYKELYVCSVPRYSTVVLSTTTTDCLFNCTAIVTIVRYRYCICVTITVVKDCVRPNIFFQSTLLNYSRDK
jgi:hypothetical protein